MWRRPRVKSRFHRRRRLNRWSSSRRPHATHRPVRSGLVAPPRRTEHAAGATVRLRRAFRGDTLFCRFEPGDRTMPSQSTTTTDHDEIREWVEQHDGNPACVRGTGSDHDIGILRIDFPGGAGEDELKHVSWDQWFEKFDASGVAFLYQNEKANGDDSTFFKLVNPEG